jgi:hypothetical protein
MILAGESRSTGRKVGPTAAFSTIYPTWPGLGSNPVLCGEKPVTDPLEPWHGPGYSLVYPGI